MREEGLLLPRKGPSPRTTSPGGLLPEGVKNLLPGLAVTRPHQVWVADLSYVVLGEGVAYLAVVMDLHTRKILGVALGPRLSQGLALAALEMALREGCPEVHHSDRGVQYTSSRSYLLLERVLEPLKEMAERVSLLGKGGKVAFPEPKNELGALGRALNRMGEEVERRERELTLLNRLLAESQALRLDELAERVLSLLVRELGFSCGDFWVEGRVVHCRACQALCPLGGVEGLAEEALREGRVVVGQGGVAVPVPPKAALVLYGKPKVDEAWLTGFLTALSGPLATALENARLYSLLEEKERQRAELLKAWLRAQEEERARIARELHDEVGQALTGLILGLEGLPGERALALKELARFTLAEVRRLALDLRPSLLDHLGLEAALVRYVREFADRTGIEVDLSFHLRQPLPKELETVVYRVVQEALTNVARHSGSPRAAVGVLEAEGEVRVFVEDEGRGFDPRAVGPGHQGLLGMRERVELLGGRFLLESAPGEGTRVQIRLPLEVVA
jgi:signal transduction histidine kinase